MMYQQAECGKAKTNTLSEACDAVPTGTHTRSDLQAEASRPMASYGLCVFY